MDKEVIELFRDKKVTIFTKNKRVFSGSITHISNTCLVLNDRFKGLMTIEFENMEEIKEINSSDFKRW